MQRHSRPEIQHEELRISAPNSREVGGEPAEVVRSAAVSVPKPRPCLLQTLLWPRKGPQRQCNVTTPLTLGTRHEGLLAALFGSDGSPLKAGLMQRLCSMSACERRAQSWGLALSRSRLGSHEVAECRPELPMSEPPRKQARDCLCRTIENLPRADPFSGTSLGPGFSGKVYAPRVRRQRTSF